MRVLLALVLVASAQPGLVVRALDDGSGDGPAYRFEPETLDMAPRQVVLVRNEGRDVHTFTHDAAPRAFHTGALDAGATAEATAPDEPGEYPFFCVFHGGMRGTLRVAEAAPGPKPSPLAGWVLLAAAASAALLLGRRS